MADLAASAVLIEDRRYIGDMTGKFRDKYVQAKLTLTGQGGVTNKIPAAVFEFKSITRAGMAVGSDNKAYIARPSFDGSRLQLYNLATNTPADITGTVRVQLYGKE